MGLVPRRLAVGIVDGVLREQRSADQPFDASDGNPVLLALNARDRAFTRNLVTVTVRQLGWLRRIIRTRLQKRLPPRAGTTEAILLVAAAQIFSLRTSDHAAVDQAVRLATEDRQARHFSGLVNGVLRSLIRDREAGQIGDPSPATILPEWLERRWQAQFGTEIFEAITARLADEPPLDLSLRNPDSLASWAERLGGVGLTNGTVRLAAGGAGSPEMLEGFSEGSWWVQDAAARLPVMLMGDVAGKAVADLAAAPGGKTAQLAAAGAQVTAVDRSAPRLDRLRSNLKRLGLVAETRVADVTEWRSETQFDAVLLDAPCSATGTLRRHPDIAWTRRETDIAALAEIQTRLLDNATQMVRPGGQLVYATCSLEPQEGRDQIERLLKSNTDFERVPVRADEIGGLAPALTEKGDAQTRPDLGFALADRPSNKEIGDGIAAGMDGFFIARLRRTS
ncbi:MAG: transcription antitermination factor NusB [Pseudomonadota bacterium]